MSSPFEFQVVGQMSLEHIESGLRTAPLLQQRDVHPFENADISFEWVTPEDVLPTSLVAVERKLNRQGTISSDMRADVGYDQYGLAEGGVILKGGPEGVTGVIPPVVVEATDIDGNPTSGILDGLHRSMDCFEVQKRGKLFVARISGALATWQAYAHTNSWAEVNVVPEKPDDKRLWKHYVGNPLNDDEYALYVDFGHLNGSRPYIQGEGSSSNSTAQRQP